MRRHLHRTLVRLAPALALALTVTAGLAVAASPAGAETMVRECKASNISCISFSGYNGKSVWGFPVGSTGNNCANYAASRLSRNGVATISGLGSGGSWAANARKKGYRVDTTPKVGSIAQWNYGSAYAPSQGHVGYVEEVTSGYIVISDSAWSGYSSRWRVPRGDRNLPSNFIHINDQAYLPPPSGSFLKVRETGETYRLVGKAPVYVSTWTAFGGTKPTYRVSSTSLATLPSRPADGTFIQGAQRREIYRIAGGAPVAISTWTAVGGAKPFVTVDQVAIDKAGTGGRYNHLLALPVEGTFVQGGQRSEVYRIAGGAPVYVSSWTAFGGKKPYVRVDQVAIDKAGTSTRFNHLRFRPLDGTILAASPTTSYYRVSGGAPVPTSTATGAKGVDKVAIQHAGDTSSPRWTHLAKGPAAKDRHVTISPRRVVVTRR
jgi:surface antigen